MATNTGAGKRIPVKWIRDKAKAAYEKDSCCYICNSTEQLELHHTHGLTNLFEKWLKDKNLIVSTDEDILALRDTFIDEHRKEIYEDVFTLCWKHHSALHSVYGKSPLLNTAMKQVGWIQKQKDKFNGLETESISSDRINQGKFGKFIDGKVKPSSGGYSKSSGFGRFL